MTLVHYPVLCYNSTHVPAILPTFNPSRIVSNVQIFLDPIPFFQKGDPFAIYYTQLVFASSRKTHLENHLNCTFDIRKRIGFPID